MPSQLLLRSCVEFNKCRRVLCCVSPDFGGMAGWRPGCQRDRLICIVKQPTGVLPGSPVAAIWVRVNSPLLTLLWLPRLLWLWLSSSLVPCGSPLSCNLNFKYRANATSSQGSPATSQHSNITLNKKKTKKKQTHLLAMPKSCLFLCCCVFWVNLMGYFNFRKQIPFKTSLLTGIVCIKIILTYFENNIKHTHCWLFIILWIFNEFWSAWIEIIEIICLKE